MKCQAGQSTSWNQDCWEKYQNLRYADDTTLMAESKEELKSHLMKVKKESEKATEFQKNIYFCFIDYTKAFDCVYHKKCGKFLKRRE